ncbi:MAG: hypothetical protein M1826_002358 [Phylliscum demangeonii]|nr:MAG: hypothetical protein M1826_002358 [Phylliscum demangeonii]
MNEPIETPFKFSGMVGDGVERGQECLVVQPSGPDVAVDFARPAAEFCTDSGTPLPSFWVLSAPERVGSPQMVRYRIQISFERGQESKRPTPSRSWYRPINWASARYGFVECLIATQMGRQRVRTSFERGQECKEVHSLLRPWYRPINWA